MSMTGFYYPVTYARVFDSGLALIELDYLITHRNQ